MCRCNFQAGVKSTRHGLPQSIAVLARCDFQLGSCGRHLVRKSNLDAAGTMGRNLIPTEVPHLEETHFSLPEPLRVRYGAIALPHPEKIADGGPKAVNRKWEGWGGEDAYFCTDERFDSGPEEALYCFFLSSQGAKASLLWRSSSLSGGNSIADNSWLRAESQAITACTMKTRLTPQGLQTLPSDLKPLASRGPLIQSHFAQAWHFWVGCCRWRIHVEVKRH